jgi:uncharacterized protein (TIGR00369 family)
MMVDKETGRDDWPQTMPFEQTFDGLYGLEIVELGQVRAIGMVRVRDAVRQPIGLVHGGVYASISEALTSLATGAGVRSEGLIATGMSNHTNFLRPIADGVIHAEAVRRHRGRTSLGRVDYRRRRPPVRGVADDHRGQTTASLTPQRVPFTIAEDWPKVSRLPNSSMSHCWQ